MSDAPSPGTAFDEAEAGAAAEGHAAAEGVESPGAGAFSGEGPIARLFDGSAPGPDVAELRADYDLPRPLAMIARGVLRVASGDGVPPIFDILMGVVLLFWQQQDDGTDDAPGADADAVAQAQGEANGGGL